MAFKLKAWVEEERDPLMEELEQLERYLDGFGKRRGTLVIFDRRPNAKPSLERISLTTTQTEKGHRLNIYWLNYLAKHLLINETSQGV